jgi:GNAT superfamily N-acetyltransferase
VESDGALLRAWDFELGSVALVADRVASIPEGWVARTASLPLVWSLNHVGVRRPIELGDALELVERHQGDLPFRQFKVEHEPSGARLEPELRSQGWKVERDVTMALSREPDQGADTSRVVEVGEEEVLRLMRRWMGEGEELRDSPEELGQAVESTRLTWRARRARHLAVVDGDGAAVAMASLFSDGVVGQLEDVYTAPEARGRGYCRALLTRAIALARDGGHELTFIVGDDQDWPKHLYAKVGFEPVGRRWVFHR